MKAILHEEYGPPEVLSLLEVDRPVPADNEVLVKVHAASVNPLDWHYMRGTPRMMRIASGIGKPKNKKLGADLAGRVEAVGKNVSEFKPGDDVFGTPKGLGALAEYACVAESGLALKPPGITYEVAAAIPVAAYTALQGLRNTGKIQQGQQVLINGSSGGVGTFAVQFAKYFGAVVTGVCSSRNVELVRSIGADRVIDYAKDDFTRLEQKFDLIKDNVGNRTVSDLRNALAAKGRCVVCGYTSPLLLLQHMLVGPLRSMVGSKKVGPMPVANPNKKDLLFIAELVKEGKVRSVIDKTYPLSETAEAIRYLETGHARAKVVIAVI